jgi:hypothetical protein
MEIDKIKAISATHMGEQWERNLKRQLRQEKLHKVQEESAHQVEQSLEELNTSLRTDDEDLNHIEEHLSSNDLKDISPELAKFYGDAVQANAELQDGVYTQYLLLEELDQIWSLFEESEKKKTELEEVIDNLTSASDGNEADILQGFLFNNAKSGRFSKAEIYCALYYALESLRQKKLKDKFQLQLKELLEKYARQECGYLFEAFSLLKNQSLQQQNISFKTIDKVTAIHSGDEILTNLKQVVEFIDKNFASNYGNLVSMYVKLSAQQLGRLRQPYLNHEDKALLQQTLDMEFYLIAAKTLYVRVQDLRDKVEKRQIKLSDDETKILLSLIDFFSTGFFSELSVKNLVKATVNGELTNNQYIQFILNLTFLINRLNMQLFNHNPKQFEKISSGLRDVLANLHNANTKSETKVSLIKVRKPSISYV